MRRVYRCQTCAANWALARPLVPGARAVERHGHIPVLRLVSMEKVGLPRQPPGSSISPINSALRVRRVFRFRPTSCGFMAPYCPASIHGSGRTGRRVLNTFPRRWTGAVPPPDLNTASKPGKPADEGPAPGSSLAKRITCLQPQLLGRLHPSACSKPITRATQIPCVSIALEAQRQYAGVRDCDRR